MEEQKFGTRGDWITLAACLCIVGALLGGIMAVDGVPKLRAQPPSSSSTVVCVQANPQVYETYNGATFTNISTTTIYRTVSC